MSRVSPVGKEMGIVTAWVMTELDIPSISFSSMGGTEYGVRAEVYCCTILRSIKQWVEPELTNASKGDVKSEILNVSRRQNEFGSERADALSLRISIAQCGVTQPSACAEEGGLHVIFLLLHWFQKLEWHEPELCWQKKRIWCNP